jgi:hypothetical protein
MINEASSCMTFEHLTDYEEYAMDAVDTDPDILRRIEHERGPPPPPPEFEALQQMLNDAINREIALRAEIVRLRRILSGG